MSLFGEPANKNAAAKQPGFRAPWHPVQEPARPVTAEPSKRLDWETGQSEGVNPPPCQHSLDLCNVALDNID
eukprot:m.112116 g.112116  ORF g.112116 m.112116 type:complete len:72 (+) comp16159_c1_seq2:190-405(+)